MEKARGQIEGVSASSRKRELLKHVAQASGSSSSSSSRSRSSAANHWARAGALVSAAPPRKPASLAELAASAKARTQSVCARMDFCYLPATALSTAAASAATAPTAPPIGATVAANLSAVAVAQSLQKSQYRAARNAPLGGRALGGHCLGGRGLGVGGTKVNANSDLRKLKQLGGGKGKTKT